MRDVAEAGFTSGQDVEELFLLRLRYKEGRLQEAGGNRPFLLDDPETVWVVYSGRIDVFAVRLHNKEVAGPRMHVLRLQAGEGLFGFRSEAGGEATGFLAVGGPDTKVLKMRRSRLAELATNPVQVGGIVRLLDTWVEKLSQAVTGNVPPKDCLNTAVGTRLPLQAGSSARSRRGPLWLQMTGGPLRFLGRSDVPVIQGNGLLFPLTRHAWVTAENKTTVQGVDSETFLKSDNPWPSLDAFHRLIERCVELNRQQVSRSEATRLQQKYEEEAAFFGAALRRLAQVLHPGDATELTALGADDALLAACRRVARTLGVTIHQPPRHKGRTSDPLRAIAQASRLRTRQVLLQDDWWRKDNGPLIAYRSEGQQPVALIPHGSHRYHLYDPITGTEQPVAAEVAASLSPTAFMFYRPLPTRALTAWDLLKLGLQGNRNDVLTIVLMGIAGGVLSFMIPLATGLLFNSIIPAGDRPLLVQLTLALGMSALAMAAFQVTRGIAVVRLEGRIGAPLEAAIWDRLLNLPTGFFRAYTAGDLAMRASGVEMIRQLLTGATIQSLLSTVFSAFGIILLLLYDPGLALVALGLLAVFVSALVLAGVFQIRHQRALLEKQGRLSGILFQLLGGISKLRVAGVEPSAFSVWAREFAAQRQLAYKVRTIGNNLAVFSSVVPLMSSFALFATLAWRGPHTLPPATFIAFHAAFGQILTGLLGVNAAFSSLLNVLPLFERLKPILDAVPEVDPHRKHPGELKGEIELSQVSFRYDPEGPLVLSEVNLYAKPGEFVAVVGPSGSGKSTLLRLLLGFEQPESGAVYYDGQDLNGLDVQAVRRQIGVVLQQSRLLAGDLYQNIVGSSLLTLDEAWEAARMAGLDDDIRRLPMGMHTMISEGGGTFSGGQRQRLLIARAVAAKPRLLFFDEATSALDNRTQEQVTRSLEALQATRIVIAHRLSTIMNADRIYVLQAGRVVQSGTYEQLLKEEGLFADLVKRQLA